MRKWKYLIPALLLMGILLIGAPTQAYACGTCGAPAQGGGGGAPDWNTVLQQLDALRAQVIAAMNAQQPVAPTTTGTTSTSAGQCLPNATYYGYRAQAEAAHPGQDPASHQRRIGHLIRNLDKEFNNNPSLGSRGETGGKLENPGPAGVSLVWTNIAADEDNLPQVMDTAKAGDVTKNWFPETGFVQGPPGRLDLGWGVFRAHTQLNFVTGFTSVRLCEKLPDLPR